MSQVDLKKVARKFRKEVLESSKRLGMDALQVKKEKIHEILAFVRDDPKLRYDLLRHLTCVDHLGEREPRFEIVYVLYSTSRKKQLVVRAVISESDCVIDTVCDLYGCANWAEREVWDMYGVKFKGHPDLRRVLLYEEFEGHPLRKDYPKQASQPRVALLKEERDAFEEFKTYHAGEPRQGSRP